MLSVKDKMTLDLAGTRFKYAGAMEAAIRERFSESTTRFYQRLGVLLDDPAALTYDAQLVNRLRRLRDQRQRQRSSRRVSFEL
jgi:hypothetical protein